VLAAAPIEASAARQTVTVSGSKVSFYASHLLLDAEGRALLDDGVLHVVADHISLDLRAKRYLAIGNVVVTQSDTAAPSAPSSAQGDVFGDDLVARRGLLVALAPEPTRRLVEGSTIEGEPTPGVPLGEPLSLPDFGGETAFATATRAVAHVGADVRLSNVKVLLPGARSAPLPSYVYTYSSDSGYVTSNLVGASEDVPWYFGSTRNSVQGLHFIYRPTAGFGFGFDDRIVNGPKGYALASLSPFFGQTKALNVTWQDQINSHTSQTLNSTTIQGFGTTNSYDLRDGIHRSYLEFTGSQYHQDVGALFAWQSYDEALAPTGAFSHLLFHLRSEVGTVHTPLTIGYSPFPSTIYLAQWVPHIAFEGYVATQPLALSRTTTLYASADDRFYHDTLPHLQSVQLYAMNVTQRVNGFVTIGAGIQDSPIHDGYPTLNASYASHFDSENASFSYSHTNLFYLTLSAQHATGSTELPAGVTVTPWSVSADTRFRVNRYLSVELGRSYFFGFEGLRFGTWTVQVFP
jgi:hypothetical protein